MFQINEDLSIYITRGDSAVFSVLSDGERKFQYDDVVRFTVYAKKNCNDVVLQKDVEVSEETDRVDFILTESDTKIGSVISKPIDYWYEVELNPFTNPQTIIGYDDDGAKIFKLFPEGADAIDIEMEDIPVIDDDFSPTSERPLANYVITRKISELESKVASTEEKITSKDMIPVTSAEMEELLKLGTWKKNTAYLVIDEDEKTDDAVEIANEALDIANNALTQNVPIERGGTGATTVEGALENLGLSNTAKIKKGIYEGNGTAQGVTLTFDFTPRTVIISDEKSYAILVYGVPAAVRFKVKETIHSTTMKYYRTCEIADWIISGIDWSIDNSLSIKWFTDDKDAIFNELGKQYNYIALG